jgi:hypothetical protein
VQTLEHLPLRIRHLALMNFPVSIFNLSNVKLMHLKPFISTIEPPSCFLAAQKALSHGFASLWLANQISHRCTSNKMG